MPWLDDPDRVGGFIQGFLKRCSYVKPLQHSVDI